MISVDHTGAAISGKTYVVVVSIDGAINFLWAYPQKPKANGEMIETLREWIETFQ